ncbi:glucosaminidase domain-containing protein, partial [Ohessyouella blattaphilus]
EEITLSGRASVNMQNATYRYIYYDGKTWNLIASDTSQKDAVWKPQKAGNYTLCYQVVMPGGREVNRFMGYDITGPFLTIKSLTASSLSRYGKVTLNTEVTTTDTDLKYTYEVYDMKVWNTVKKDSSTSAVEWTPTKEGTYLVNVTVTSASGLKESYAVGTEVAYQAEITGFTLDKSNPQTVGTVIGMLGSAKVDVEGAIFRYIYFDGVTWNEIYSSNKLERATWTPTRASEYDICFQIILPNGRILNKMYHYHITDVHSILGKTEVSVQQLCNYYKKSGATFPTDRYKCPTGKNPSDYASTLEAFCTMYVQEANKYGVKAEVAFVQAMLETNYLRYGGDVKAEQFNFAGLGATGNGEPGNVFANVRTGVKAQIQHLYCYASTEPLPSGELLVDQRWSNNLRGKAPYVEWLAIKKNPYGTGWAAAEDYGESIVKGLKIIQGL